MFKTRLLSGIVLVAIALLTIMSGGYCSASDAAVCFSDRHERAVQRHGRA